MKNNDKYFDEILVNKENKIMNSLVNSNAKKEYKNIFLCPLKKHDAINCMDMLDDFIIYGTIMGNAYLCRVDKKNLIPTLQKEYLNDLNLSNMDNSKISKKNATIDEIKAKNKIDDSSKISCIKLDSGNIKNTSNINNKLNKIDILKKDKNNKMFYDSDIIPTTRSIYNKIKNHEANTKRKLLNKNILHNKNNQSDLSIINQNSLISQSQNSDFSNNLIPFPQVTQIITNASENIPCLSFDTKDCINVAIGDLEIIRIENILNFNINDDNSEYKYTIIKNYKNENDHMKYCEGTTCLMHKNNFIKIDGYINEYNSNLCCVDCNYENKTITSYDIKKGLIEMNNYNVPFDFDGDRFLFLDYENKNFRRICVYYTLSNIDPYIHQIPKEFGHINFMKFYSFNKIILCKENKICEIRLLDENFKLVETWEHLGDEIVAMNIYFKSIENNDIIDDSNDESYLDNKDKRFKKLKNLKNKDKFSFNDNNIYGINPKLHIKKFPSGKEKINNSTYRELNNIIKPQLKPKGENIYDPLEENDKNNNDDQIAIYNKNKIPSEKENITNEINNKKNLEALTINNEYTYIQSNKAFIVKKKKISYYNQEKNGPTERSMDDEEKRIHIITVDKKGNVNKYNKGKIKTIFNLYDIKNIEQNYKDEEFFSLGFPYFVKMNNRYYAISTDHGIFVLSNKE